MAKADVLEENYTDVLEETPSKRLDSIVQISNNENATGKQYLEEDNIALLKSQYIQKRNIKVGTILDADKRYLNIQKSALKYYEELKTFYNNTTNNEVKEKIDTLIRFKDNKDSPIISKQFLDYVVSLLLGNTMIMNNSTNIHNSISLLSNYFFNKLRQGFIKEFNRLLKISELKQESFYDYNTLFNDLNKYLSDLPFEKCNVDIVPEKSIKAVLIFPNNRVLMVTKRMNSDIPDDKVIFSYFVNRKLINSDIVILGDFINDIFKKHLEAV